MSQLGPCVICGVTNYALSMGGPTICPKCDCGAFDSATVELQAKAMQKMRAEIERLRAALQPFARMADQVDEWQKSSEPHVDFSFDADDLRRARAALANQQDSSLREKSDD